MKEKIGTLEQTLKVKSKDYAQLKVSNNNTDDKTSSLKDKIQQLKLQLGKKELLIAKQENTIKKLESQSNQDEVHEMAIYSNEDHQARISELEKQLEAKEKEINDILYS